MTHSNDACVLVVARPTTTQTGTSAVAASTPKWRTAAAVRDPEAHWSEAAATADSKPTLEWPVPTQHKPALQRGEQRLPYSAERLTGGVLHAVVAAKPTLSGCRTVLRGSLE